MLYSKTIHKFALTVESKLQFSFLETPVWQSIEPYALLKHLNSFDEFSNLGLVAKYLHLDKALPLPHTH